ncbi:MAG: GNAT family N-acetyltransferase [Propionibacteriales bacterium]|nr:GNAT family N-acetyltransferase [Propionibacteriales bacterium]
MSGIEHVTLVVGEFELRPPVAEDAAGALAMLQDPDVRQWDPGPTDLDLDRVRAWCEKSADWSDGSFACWTVREDSRLVGYAYLNRIDRESQRSAGVAYRTAPWARGRGVASSALVAITAFAFDELGLERLLLPHAVANPASCRVADKCGYLLEGVERGGFRDEAGRRWDAHIHGRLADGVVVQS